MPSKRLESQDFDSRTESEKTYGYDIKKVILGGKEVTLYNDLTMEEFEQVESLQRSRYTDAYNLQPSLSITEFIAKLKAARILEQ